MSMSIGLDADFDMYLDSDGNLALVSGGDELTQRVRTRLKLIRGDSLFRPSVGLPGPATFVGNRHNENEIEAIMKREILSVEGVSRITRFAAEYDRQSRTFRIDWAAIGDGVEIEDINSAN